MKKFCTILLGMMLAASLAAGCGQSGKSNQETKAAEAQTTEAQTTEAQATEAQTTEAQTAEAQAPEGIYLAYNGVNVQIGMAFADVKDGLGEEMKPAETIGSCDENSDWTETTHYYPGFVMTEDKDGNITGFTISEFEFEGKDAALNGQLKLGATSEEAKAVLKDVLGDPDTEDETSIYYNAGPWVGVMLDEDSKTVNSIMVMTGMTP